MGDEADRLIDDGLNSHWEGYDMDEDWYDSDDTEDFGDRICVAETQKAICVLMQGEEQWIPRSCLGPRNEVEEKGRRGRLSVATWFVEKEGLE